MGSLELVRAGTVLNVSAFVVVAGATLSPVPVARAAETTRVQYVANSSPATVYKFTVRAGSLRQSADRNETKRSAIMDKLALLRSLSDGWDGPGSVALDPDSAKNFEDLIDRIDADRYQDAEPVLTDQGLIRLEWSVSDYAYSAEIGGSTLYMCALAPSPDEDDDVELPTYDRDRLLNFFQTGKLR